MGRKIKAALVVFLGVVLVPILGAAVSQFTAVISLPTISALQSLGAASAFYPNVTVQEYASGTGAGGGVFTWDASSSTTTNKCTVFAASGVSTGRWRRSSGSSVLSVQDCGAVGDGSTDDSASLQAAFTNISTGGSVIIPSLPSCYRSVSTLSVTKSVVISGTGSICFPTTGAPGITVSASNVTFDGVTLIGPQYASYNGLENGIQASGVFHSGSAPTNITNFTAKNLTITSWGGAGIEADYIVGFLFENNNISNSPYAGISILSGSKGGITGNTISNITGVGSPGLNAYGILVSRKTDDAGELTSNPRSSYIDVTRNKIDGVPTWEALDTHCGDHTVFSQNVINNTLYGISVGGCRDSSGTDYVYAPIDTAVVGNVMTSGVTDGSRGTGIPFTGTTTQAATGTISGNLIRGYGAANTAADGAILSYYSSGLTITGNSILYPSPNAIALTTGAIGTVISGNSIVDPWTNSVAVNQAAGVYTTGDNNSPVIGNNSFLHVDKSATYLLTTASGAAIVLGSGSGNTAGIGINNTNATFGLVDNNNTSNATVQAHTVYIPALPTSSSGLPSGALWSNSNVVTVVP